MSDASATLPASVSATEIAKSTRTWLWSLTKELNDRNEAPHSALCHILVAAWICEAMLPEGSAAHPTNSNGFTPLNFSETARRIASTLNASASVDDAHEVKPTLKLLVEILFSSEGLIVEPFRQFFDQSVSICGLANPVSELDLSLADKCTLLHRSGILPSPIGPSLGFEQMVSDQFRFPAPAEAVEVMALQLEFLTGWGTRPIAHAAWSAVAWLGEVLAGLVVERLRNYDLMSAARLLRLHGYLVAGEVTQRRDDLYDALCMHRQPHGPFGWFGPETAALHKVCPTLREELEFYLVTTLECLWTLAEKSGRWRLLGNVPPYRTVSCGRSARHKIGLNDADH
jgi:hypothetical protein